MLKGIVTLALVLVATVGPKLLAQRTTGELVGTVKDPTGALIPGVLINVQNTQTGLTRTLKTDSAGNYHATLLPVGTYEVSAEATGSKKRIISEIVLLSLIHI